MPGGEAHERLQRARRGLTYALPPGFAITELQRKQAMLNASKQQATGKPKGKRGKHPTPWAVPALTSKAMAAGGHPHPWRGPLATLLRRMYSKVVKSQR